MAGVFAIVMALRTDWFHIKLILSVVAECVIIFMSIVADINLIGAIETWKVIRMRDRALFNEIVDAATRL
jgi:uncharacterized oligopeptide transporter (OPT) family protein